MVELLGLLKGVQTAMAVTSLALIAWIGSAFWRLGLRSDEGRSMGLIVLLWSFTSLLLYGGQAWFYWVEGVEQRVQLPLPLTLLGGAGFLTVGALFLATTQPAGRSPVKVFVGWSALVAGIVLGVALAY